MRVSLVAGLVASFGASALAMSVSGYDVFVYDHSGAPITGFRDVDSEGDVVGYYQTDPADISTAHALRFTGGAAETIDPPSSMGDSRAFGINDAGDVVGSYQDLGQHGFILSGSTFTQIDYPGSSQGTTIRGLNDLGDIVGEYDDPSGFQHGFARISGVYSLVDVPGATASSVRAINDAGRMVGYYADASGALHGFFTDNGVDFTTLDRPGAFSTLIGGLNDAGAMVGVHLDGPGSPDTVPAHGFVYEGGSFTAFEISGAMSTLPIGINDDGVIAGEFIDSGGGTHHAFIAWPVPEPSGPAGLLGGAAGLFLAARRRRAIDTPRRMGAECHDR